MRLTTAGIIATFILAILSNPHAPAAPQPPKVPRIGILWFGSPVVGSSPHFEAFRQGLRELGYTEGQNIVIETRHAVMRPALLPDLAANLVLSKVDVIVAAGIPRFMPPGTRRARSPSSWWRLPTPWGQGWSPAWRDQVGTSRGQAPFPRS